MTQWIGASIFCVVFFTAVKAMPYQSVPILPWVGQPTCSSCSAGPDLSSTCPRSEALMTSPELINHWGYPVETHQVVTEDGYILQLHRIPHGKGNMNNCKTRPVIFLQHGLFGSSSSWLLNTPSQSAGFLFADAGFDVWLGNMRGNIYSDQHVCLQKSNPRFWRFSWEDMARYDLPAMIDYVLATTNSEQIYYVGHSQGTMTMFAKLSTDPCFAKKIRKFFALAPVARMAFAKGLFHEMGEANDQLQLMYNTLGDMEFFSSDCAARRFIDSLCSSPLKRQYCENLIYYVSGPNCGQLDTSRIPAYLAHNFMGTSLRNVLHFTQMIKNKRMSHFDMGPERNSQCYGTRCPPEYNLSNISVLTYLVYSDNDWIAGSSDVESFIAKSLPSKKIIKLVNFNHCDFLWGSRAKNEVYGVIERIINEDSRIQDCS